MISEPFVISTGRSEWRNLGIDWLGWKISRLWPEAFARDDGEWDIEIND